MKKTIIAAFAALVIGSAAFAAGARDTVSVEGVLAVAEGIPTVQAKDQTWVIPAGPFYQVAWENGIKVGDKLKIEGFSFEGRGECAIENAKMIMPAKVWVNGKELDLSAYADSRGFGMGRGMGRGAGCGGNSGRGPNGGRGYAGDDEDRPFNRNRR